MSRDDHDDGIKPCLGKSRYFTRPDRVSNAVREDLRGCYSARAFEKVFGRANFGHRMLGHFVSRRGDCVHAFVCVSVCTRVCVLVCVMRVRVCVCASVFENPVFLYLTCVRAQHGTYECQVPRMPDA